MRFYRTYVLEVLCDSLTDSGERVWRWCSDDSVSAVSRKDAAEKMGLKLSNLGPLRRIRLMR